MAEKRAAEKQLTPEGAERAAPAVESDFPRASAEEMAKRKVVKAHHPSSSSSSAAEQPPAKNAEEEQPEAEDAAKPKPFSFGADVGGASTFAGLAKLGGPFSFDFKLPAASAASPFAGLAAPAASSSSSSSSASAFAFAAPPAEGGGDENPESEVAAHEGAARVAELPKEQLKTGEEDEDTALEVAPAKLYRMDPQQRTWKEVCRGAFRVKVHRTTGRARLLMRAEATLAVKLNVAVMRETGCGVDGATGKAVSLMVVETPEGASKPEAAAYIVRVGSKDKADAIVAKVRELSEKAKPVSASSAAPEEVEEKAKEKEEESTAK